MRALHELQSTEMRALHELQSTEMVNSRTGLWLGMYTELEFWDISLYSPLQSMPFVQQFQHSVDTIKLNVGIRTLSEMKFMRFPQLNCIFEREGGGKCWGK